MHDSLEVRKHRRFSHVSFFLRVFQICQNIQKSKILVVRQLCSMETLGNDNLEEELLWEKGRETRRLFLREQRTLCQRPSSFDCPSVCRCQEETKSIWKGFLSTRSKGSILRFMSSKPRSNSEETKNRVVKKMSGAGRVS